MGSGAAGNIDPQAGKGTGDRVPKHPALGGGLGREAGTWGLGPRIGAAGGEAEG